MPLPSPGETARPAPRLIDAPLDGGNFQVRVDLLVDDDQLSCFFQVAYALRQRSITHVAALHACQAARTWPAPPGSTKR